MTIDHSETYRKKRLKNIPHILRLNKIIKIVCKQKLAVQDIAYADIGCSNGYITNLISNTVNAKYTVGFDHSDNIQEATLKYKRYNFKFLDLNTKNLFHEKFDLVTCFETLEHVGNLEEAIKNIIKLTSDKGTILISVPIEIGAIGIIKYLIKRLIYRYTLPLMCSDRTYLLSLILKKDISQYRQNLSGHGSHFGFNYKKVDDFLLKNSTNRRIKAFNFFTTRFYLLEPNH